MKAIEEKKNGEDRAEEKRAYVEPEMTMVALPDSDVITTSGEGFDIDGVF